MNDLENLTEEQLEKALQEKRKLKHEAKKKRIKQFEKDRDDFVSLMIESFKSFRSELTELKETSISKGNQLYTELYEMHNKQPKKCKQFSLIHKEGNMKVVLDRHEKMTFSNEADVAITTIKEFFKTKFEDRSKTVYSMLNTLLEKNGKGDYDPKMLAKIRPHINKIADPILTEAFELLENSQVVSGSSLYLRAYEKDENDKWKDIVIQFSSL